MGTPSHLPPPPPPPPPPPGYSTWPIGWRENRTVSGVRKIRDGISLYKFVALITVLLVIVSYLPELSMLVTGNAFSITPIGAGTPIGNNSASTPTGPSFNMWFLLFLAVYPILSIVSLVLVILSWVRWREGLNEVNGSWYEYGAEHRAYAQAAKKDYDGTVWMFVISLIFSVVASVVLGVVLYTIVSFPSPASSGSILSSLHILMLVFLAVFALLNYLMYYFASRSPKATFYALARIDEKILLGRARTYVLIGGALPFVGGALVAIGMYKFQQAYDTWLANPRAMPNPVLS